MYRLILLFGLCFFLLPAAWAQSYRTPNVVPYVPSAVLMDYTSGRILWEKNDDLVIPPASLTKLMTLHLAWKALESGKVTNETLVPITAQSEYKALGAGSSLMYLEKGQIVTYRELMLGLAVDSGNDAGLTLALFLNGTEEAFVSEMNAEAKRLKLENTVFYDSYGLSEKNKTTALDYTMFCRDYIQEHPSALALLHRVREMAYPQARNYPPSYRGAVKTILQSNRNSLLFSYPGVDGLKTGYIDESGYNLAVTAMRGDQRLIAVILGIKANSTSQGNALRTDAGTKLLNYGFENFPLTELPLPQLTVVHGWYMKEEQIHLTVLDPTFYPLARGEIGKIQAKMEAPSDVIGPFPANRPIGKVSWILDGKLIAQAALVSETPVHEADFFKKIWHSIVLFFRGLFGNPPPVDLSAA